jgi:hypothetical protein
MALGPGKYDDLCTKAREEAGAAGCILIIFDGKSGHGFSAQLPPGVLPFAPILLRDVADQIEKSIPSDLRDMLHEEIKKKMAEGML